MNSNYSDTSVFNRLRFVLVDTSHPGNIGATARAMKTMGFHDLVLVNPRFEDVLSHPEAIAFASGAQDILASAKIVTDFRQAIADCNFVAAVSARLREFSPPIMTPREFSLEVQQRAIHQVALVFGSERYGLPNDIVLQAQTLINIPANPDYSSLNLAQAVQLLAYELRVTALAMAQTKKSAEVENLASHDEIQGMLRHLEQALIEIQFLRPDNPKKLMPRLSRLFARARLEQEEIHILRGIAKRILERGKSGEI